MHGGGVDSARSRRVLPAGAALAGLMAGAAAAIAWAGRGVGLIGDQWAWIFDASALTPGVAAQDYNGHLMATTYVLYAGLLHVAGLPALWAYRAVALALHLAVVLLAYLVAARRAGPRVGLLAAAPLAFLGTGSDVFLSGLNYNFLLAAVAGLGALLALDAGTRRGDGVVCALLLAGLLSFTTTVAFAAGVAVELLWRRQPRRLWAPLLPLAAWATWRVAHGMPSETAGGGSPGPIATLHHALESAAGAFAGLAGVQLFSPTLTGRLPWLPAAAQLALVLGALAAAALLVRRRAPVTPRLVNVVAAGAVLWLMMGAGRAANGDPYASRYVYAGAVVALLILVELVAATAPHGRGLGAVAVAVVAASTVLNAGWMLVWARHLRDETTVARVRLAAVELASPAVAPGFRPARDFALGAVTAGRYLGAVERFGGSPAYRPDELARLPEGTRRAADGVLIRAVRARVVARPARPAGRPPQLERAAGAGIERRGACIALTPRAGTAVAVVTSPPSGEILVASRAQPTVGLRRFASSFTPLGRAPRRAIVLAPPGRSPTPWHVRLTATAPTRVCAVAPA